MMENGAKNKIAIRIVASKILGGSVQNNAKMMTENIYVSSVGWWFHKSKAESRNYSVVTNADYLGIG